MDAYKTHGAFSWNELMTPDPQAALKFYTALFGWKTEPMQMQDGGTYTVVKAGEASVGGVMSMPPDSKGMPPTWGSYVTVSDVDAVAKQAVTLGGKVVHGPEDIPKIGRFAVIVDPQGASLNVITYAMPSG